MKKIVQVPVKVEKVVEQVTEMKNTVIEEDDGFESYLGKRIFLHCMNYNYSGKLVGINGNCLKLEDGGVVFETGSYNAKEFKDFQKLPNNKPLYVQKNTIESWWEV